MSKQKQIAEILKKLKNKRLVVVLGIVALFFLISLVFWLSKPNEKIVMAHQQVSDLATNIRRFYQAKPDAWGLNTSTAIKNGLPTPQMINGRQLQNALGKEVLLGADILGNTVMPGSRNAVIVYKNLNKEECEVMATMSFDEKMQLSLNTISIVNEKEYKFTWGGENSLPVSEAKADEICLDANDILWDIYL